MNDSCADRLSSRPVVQCPTSKCPIPVSGWQSTSSKNMHLRKQERPVAVFSLCVRTQQFEGLTFTSAHVLVRAHVDGPGFSTHRHMGPQQCEVRACTPTLAFAPLHVCVIARRLGSHTQQDLDIFQSASTSRRSISICLTPLTSENHNPQNWR